MNETALKDKLKTIAKDKGVGFNELWKQLLLERFLARLSRSKHQDKFIFKGALLLSQHITLGRETTDIDFLMTKLKSELPVIEKAFDEIMSEKVNDGFLFSWARAKVLEQPHMGYPGYRVSLGVRYGKMKDQIQIDIGVGDVVKPIKNELRIVKYKGKPMFEGEITLLTYPMETIFAEKLETIIAKGPGNSRMKDFHDVLLMTYEKDLLDLKKLTDAIMATFKHRNTPIRLPIKFQLDDLTEMKRLWIEHKRGLKDIGETLDLPENVEEVIAEINKWLSKNLQSIMVNS